MAQEQETISPVTDLNSRIRVLESRYNLFSERLLIVNKNMINEYKKLTTENKAIDLELKELKNDIFEIKEILKRITDEMHVFARKENIKVLEKYINFWNPLEFIKEEEVREIVKQEINKSNKKLKGEKIGSSDRRSNKVE
jgi:hypothetical protein|tara:strand:- start:89249 stop:89668 length:420 start_codon:yes stop_codon:yes gene_type:complete